MPKKVLPRLSKRRPEVSPAVLATIAGGRPVGANDALRDGLVDSIGYLDDTLRALRTRLGDVDARVVMYRRPQEFAENLYSRGLPTAPQVNLVNVDVGALAQPPQFMYLWLPPTP